MRRTLFVTTLAVVSAVASPDLRAGERAALPPAPTLVVAPAAVDSGGLVSVVGVVPGARALLRPAGGGRERRLRVAERTDEGIVLRVEGDSGAYEVVVRDRRGREIGVAPLTIRPPRVASIEDLVARGPRDVFVLNGANFGRRRGRVLVGGEVGRVRGWRDDRIRVSLPRPVTGPHDVVVETRTDRAVVPCGLLVCSDGDDPVPAETLPEETTQHDAWRFDWEPGLPGSSSAYMTTGWHGATFLYDPVLERFRFETNVAATVPVDGIYLMVNGGGWAAKYPDEEAEVFFDLHHGAPRISVFAYKSRAIGDTTGDGWTDDPSRPADRILSSLIDPSFVLATVDRQEADGSRTVGFTIAVHEINRHKPMYRRTDGSAWRGLQFDQDVGVWMYLEPSADSTYEAGWLTDFEFERFGSYPSVDGPDFHATRVAVVTDDPTAPVPTPNPVPTPVPDPVPTPVPDETYSVGGGTELPVLRGGAGADALTGTGDADAFRIGTADVVDAGDGDDVVLVDRTTGAATVDGGSDGLDVIVVRRDPFAPRTGGTGAGLLWSATLVLDATLSDPNPSATLLPTGEIDLGTDASGRLVLPLGGTIEFRGIERIRL